MSSLDEEIDKMELQNEIDRWRLLACAAVLVAVALGGIMIGRASAPSWSGERTFTIRLDSTRPHVPALPAPDPIGVESAQ